jgi:hypothetical protein
MAARELHKAELEGIRKREREKREADKLDAELEDIRKREREKREADKLKDGSGSDSSGSSIKSDSGSESVRDTEPAATRDAPALLLFGDDELKKWTIGTAAYKQGLNWEAYVRHKQAYDNYMQHKGKWSDRSFKSIIHAKLVPTVCAICGFRRSKWRDIENSTLILKLELAAASVLLRRGDLLTQ